MKCIAVVMLTACLQCFAVIDIYAQINSVTLSFKEAPLDDVLLEIREQTGINLLYETYFLKQSKPVTIEVKNVTILQALDICFADQPFTYAISGNVVTITERDFFDKQKLRARNYTEISGIVTSTTGAPLQGASVSLKGATKGTFSDENGQFVLKSSKNPELEVSHIGYNSQVIKVNKTGNIHIVLEINLMSLDAVETNGYSSIIRRYNLGTTKKITSEEIGQQPINNPLAALQARVTSLTAVQNSGLPGSGFNIQIRGQKSVGVSVGALPPNSPLFVIDGVPFLTSAESLTQTSAIMANSPFSTINPDDIGSIEILKDANATAIYGSLGANGVVLITTRKPMAGKTSVDVKMSTGWGKVARTIDYMNTNQYLQMRREALANDGAIPTIGNAKDLLLWDTTRNTDWKKELIGGTAHYSNAHIRLSGGSEQTQFTASVGYNKETTVFPGSSNKSLVSMSVQVGHITENKKLDVLLAASFGQDKSNLLRTDLTSAIEYTAPNAPDPFDSFGNLMFRQHGETFNNPYVAVVEPYDFTMNRLTASLKLNYKILPSLQFRSNIGYNSLMADEYAAVPIAAQDPALHPTGEAKFGQSKSTNWLIEPQLEFTKNIGEKSKLKAILGTSMREQILTKQLATASGYTDDAFLKWMNGASDVAWTNDYKQYRLQSFYGLLNYAYQNKYLVEFTARRDGSSRFGPKKQFGNFGSFAAGWIMTNEKFIKKALPFLSYGKLRISYGTTGNDQVGDYEFLDNWMSTQYPYLPQIPNYIPVRLYNNDFRWELHRSTDISLDLGFLSDRIVLTAIYNQSKTNNQLISYPLPAQAGFAKVLRNSPGSVGNKNIELELSSVILRKNNLKWKTSVNVTISRNKLLHFPDLATSTYRNYYVIGQPLNLAWGYRTAGIDPATGVYQILDRDGNIIPIPNSFPSDEDIVSLATYNPVYYGGFYNNVQLGNWTLDILFQFVNQKGKNHVVVQSENAGFSQFNQPVAVLNRWRKPGDITPYQQYTQDASSTAFIAATFRSASDALLTDASFIRLKTLSVAYALPTSLLKKLKVKNCSIALQAQNLLTITSYKGSHDPESGTVNPRGLPPLQIITFGIRATL